jgi:hypothetical protein
MKNKAAQNLVALRWKHPKRRKAGLEQLKKARRAKLDKKLKNTLSTSTA